MTLTRQQIIDRIRTIEAKVVYIEMGDADDHLALYERLLDELDVYHELLSRFDPRPVDSDREWRQEMANEAGMLHGVDDYNDIMGN